MAVVTVCAAAALFFTSCPVDDGYYWNASSRYQPEYMSRAALEQSVRYESKAYPLKNTGKIYYKAPYIYLNEKYKGVHVIDNSDARNPRNVGFIHVPGCLDMAVKGSTMFVDNSVDLVCFDLDAKKEIGREKKMFPEPCAPDNLFYPPRERPDDFIIVGWTVNTNRNSSTDYYYYE